MSDMLDIKFLRDDLVIDPESSKHYPNNTTRAVKTGHYLHVKTEGLKKPFYIIHSDIFASKFELTKDECKSKEFVNVFSANTGDMKDLKCWVTPYAT
eukprot:UN00457